FFQAEDGIRDFHVTGVQTCALPIFGLFNNINQQNFGSQDLLGLTSSGGGRRGGGGRGGGGFRGFGGGAGNFMVGQQSGISRTNRSEGASCRERVYDRVGRRGARKQM